MKESLPIDVGNLLVSFSYLCNLRNAAGRPRTEELLHNTKKFIDITDEDGFLNLLKKDLNDEVLYYTKDIVLTENYIFCKTLGLWDKVQFFNWANDLLVIPRIMIEKMNIDIDVTRVSHYAALAHTTMRAKIVTGEWQKNVLLDNGWILCFSAVNALISGILSLWITGNSKREALNFSDDLLGIKYLCLQILGVTK